MLDHDDEGRHHHAKNHARAGMRDFKTSRGSFELLKTAFRKCASRTFGRELPLPCWATQVMTMVAATHTTKQVP
jgi:hypothetical protein